DDRVGAGRAAREHHVAPDRARARSAPPAVRTDDRSRGDAGRNRAAADAEPRARPADRGPRPAEAARRARPGRLIAMVRLAVVLLAVAGATPVLPARSGPAGTPDQADVVFFEGFDAAPLDRSAWNVITDFHVNNEQQAYIDSPDTIAIVTDDEAQGADGGALRLRALYRPGETRQLNRTFDFVSGRIDTRDKVTFTYGTAAARIRLTAGEGLWPAFWALGAGRWPDTGEIDIMENVGDPSWVNAALHGPGYSGDTPLVRRRPFPPGEDATGWHVYAVRW